MNSEKAIWLIGQIEKIIANDNHPVNQIAQIEQAIQEIKSQELDEAISSYFEYLRRKRNG